MAESGVAPGDDRHAAMTTSVAGRTIWRSRTSWICSEFWGTISGRGGRGAVIGRCSRPERYGTVRAHSAPTFAAGAGQETLRVRPAALLLVECSGWRASCCPYVPICSPSLRAISTMGLVWSSCPLPFAARDRFDTTVNTRSDAPEKVDILTIAQAIEMWRNNQQVNVAPLIDRAGCLRAKDHAKADRDAQGNELVQVASDTRYN